MAGSFAQSFGAGWMTRLTGVWRTSASLGAQVEKFGFLYR
jgi:hypothetical protein